MFKIYYDNSDVFSGLAPTPFIERQLDSVYQSKKVGGFDSFTLEGTITGDCNVIDNNFSGLWERGKSLIDRFSTSFKNFYIVDEFDGGREILFSGDHAMVKGINFPDNKYYGILPFQINLDLYKNEDFIPYGIFSPSQEIKFNSEENGIINVTKVTSAVGFQTDLPAIENAISFVSNYSGIPIESLPTFISSEEIDSFILLSFDEKIDRINGSYQLSEQWQYDPIGASSAKSIYRSNYSIGSGVGGVSISIEGSLVGGSLTTIQELRDDFNSLDLVSKIEEIYSGVNPSGSIILSPFKKTINENVNEKSLSFSFEYRDSIFEDPYIIDNFKVSWDRDRNKYCSSLQLNILSSDPCLSSRWAKINDYYDNLDVVEIIKDKYEKYGYSGNLSNSLQNKSTNFDRKNSSISLSAAVCEKNILIPSHFEDINYSVQITPGIPTYIPFQGLNSQNRFTIQKFSGLRRKIVSIRGDGIISECSSREQASSSLKSYINNLKSSYLSENDTCLIEDEIKFGSGQSSKKLSFSFSWSEKDPSPLAESIFNSSF